ncbi:hypothetical protein CVS30_12575 [Arthrobacter psychrolactophilus]|uniref:DUF1254 domain-containing protein n=1 Tax=Arthrobacter psychrolactophilus TaxID=92442 RepID=A0A2V5IN71_9MICC|nr:DUF1254 domain-containing protein [Arthrobacter psychrolactophilus]PYI38048.1 hypothetical protein CVS30_12575 [Arthrobacter psychrolactophilus]
MPPLDSSAVQPAYIFGIPLVFNLDQVLRYVQDGVGANPQAPFNTFSHARNLAGPADTFVSINNDTLYSMAQLDLSVGPLLLSVPDTAGRYYVLQFVDAWTNNFAYVGHRATGTGAATFLIVPHGWSGQTPPGTTVITAPTRIVSIVGRWACAGPDDLSAVHQIQDATLLEQLESEAIPRGIPVPDAAVPEELLFLEKLRLWSQEFPPADRDATALAGFAPLGITQSGSSPYVGLDGALVAEVASALAGAQNTLAEFLRTGQALTATGWGLANHAFDYNVDFFEVGTLNEPLYTSMNPLQRPALRAAAALAGLWGNHAYEAAYATIYVDADGEQLVGSNNYVLHFDPAPPVGAFWSLTMYSVPEFFLVDNSARRYSIGDRTSGLISNADGSIDIYLGAEEPIDPARRANWLPAPEGDFRPLLRMYEPDVSIINGSYPLPAVHRFEEK